MAVNEGLGPAIPRRRLGSALRKLREERGKPLQDVARDLLISSSKLSRIEKGQGVPQERDVRDLLDYYGQAGTELGGRMRRWAAEGRETPWWHEPGFAAPPAVDQYLDYETAAHRISGYVSHVVPSLLQTEPYARAVLGALARETPQSLDQQVAFQLRRQAVLHREKYPLHLDVVMDEAVLHRLVGSPAIMREQLQVLVAAAARPTVTLRVLRFSAGPHPAMAEGVFTVFGFRRDIDQDVVNIEGRVTDVYVETAEGVRVYQKLLDELRGVALDPESSIALISQMAASY